MSQPDVTSSFPEDDLRAFTYIEVAQRLGLSLVTVKRLVYSGRLKSMHVGRRVLIPASAIREFLTATTA